MRERRDLCARIIFAGLPSSYNPYSTELFSSHDGSGGGGGDETKATRQRPRPRHGGLPEGAVRQRRVKFRELAARNLWCCTSARRDAKADSFFFGNARPMAIVRNNLTVPKGTLRHGYCDTTSRPRQAALSTSTAPGCGQAGKRRRGKKLKERNSPFLPARSHSLPCLSSYPSGAPERAAQRRIK